MTATTPTTLPRRHIAAKTEQRECEKHGTYTATLWALDPPVRHIAGKAPPTFLAPFWGNCPTCDGEIQREADARDAEIRGGMTERQRLAAARLRAAGIPPRYADSTLWNWQHGLDQQRRCWQWARDYASTFEAGIESGRSGIFLGAPGTGKTHLGIGLLRHVVEKGGTGLYVTAMSMLGRIKDTYGRHAHESEAQVIEQFASVDLLVVDEVGKQLDSNYEQAQFFRILDLRYQNLRPTLLVSNLPAKALRDFLGESVVDRMREAGGRICVFDWASQRSAARRTEEE